MTQVTLLCIKNYVFFLVTGWKCRNLKIHSYRREKSHLPPGEPHSIKQHSPYENSNKGLLSPKRSSRSVWHFQGIPQCLAQCPFKNSTSTAGQRCYFVAELHLRFICHPGTRSQCSSVKTLSSSKKPPIQSPTEKHLRKEAPPQERFPLDLNFKGPFDTENPENKGSPKATLASV